MVIVLAGCAHDGPRGRQDPHYPQQQWLRGVGSAVPSPLDGVRLLRIAFEAKRAASALRTVCSRAITRR
jgi:hypothetical protein